MKKVRRVLHFLRAVVRPCGFAHFDDEGRATGWYAVCLFYFLVEIIAKVLYVYRISTTMSYFSTRPVQLMVVMTSLLVSIAGSFTNLLHVRHPLSIKDFQLAERLLGYEIDYSLRFIVLDIIIVSILDILRNAIVYSDWLASGIFTPLGMAEYVFARALPNLMTYIGAMYHCSLLQIFKEQLHSLRKCRINQSKLSYVHHHLLTCCTALHRSYRHQLVICTFGTVLMMLSEGIFTHERFLSYLKGDTTVYGYLFPGTGLAFSLLKLFNICKTCHSVQIAVDHFVQDSLSKLEKKENVQMDRALIVYLISRPRFNTSLGGYFKANLGLLITITSSTGLYYLLMVQMNIIKSKIYS